jgi:YfiH family protein
MIRRTKNGLVWFEFEKLNQFSNLMHFQSTRKGGQSQLPFVGLNLGYGSDNEENVLANRLNLTKALGFSAENVVAQNQIHSINIQLIDKSHAGSGFYSKADAINDCDGMITNETGICLWAFGADCVPILFYDFEQNVIAAEHAGWKGSLNNIAGQTVQAMKENYGSLPENIIAALGAGIGVKYYEIGDEVVQAVIDQFGIDEPFLIRNPKTGRYHLDLYNTNLFLLYQAGLKADNIQISDLCTFEHADLFYSARRDKITGRQVAGIMLNADADNH